MNQIDARGLACPEPVILTKKELKLHPEGIEIMVDNEAAKINVERFLKIAGFKIEIEERAYNDFLIIAEKS